MNEARIAELLAPFLGGGAEVLSPAQLQSISMYIDILLRWNARMNLTAVRAPEEIVTRHFGESIFAARHLFPGSNAAKPPLTAGAGAIEARVIDVGSGAGFPGLPIKIWAPHVYLTLIESNQKKATFLREVVRNLALANVDVFAGRADAYTDPKGDVVTLRAVERFEAIVPVAERLVAPSGCVAILIGEAQLETMRELSPGLQWNKPTALPLSSARIMIIGSKEPG